MIQGLIDGELDAGTLMFYTGSPPQSTADAPSGVTALADVTLQNPSALLIHLVAINEITLLVGSGFVNVAGTVGWARMKSVDGANVYDFLVSTSAAANTLVVNTVTWTVGQSITISVLDAMG